MLRRVRDWKSGTHLACCQADGGMAGLWSAHSPAVERVPPQLQSSAVYPACLQHLSGVRLHPGPVAPMPGLLLTPVLMQVSAPKRAEGEGLVVELVKRLAAGTGAGSATRVASELLAALQAWCWRQVYGEGGHARTGMRPQRDGDRKVERASQVRW